MKDANKVILLTADAIVKAGMGVLRTVIFTCNDAAPTAGSIDIYDGVDAATGTKIFSETFTTTPFRASVIPLSVAVTKGIFVDFTTTADVNATVVYE